MNCFVCGKELREGARFCPNCGVNLAEAPIVEEKTEPEVILEETVAPVTEEVPNAEEAPVAEEAPAEEAAPQPQVKSPYEYDPVPRTEPAQKRRAYWLPEKRSWWKLILFGILTFGIYDLVVLSEIPEETNMVVNGRDGERTMQYWWAMLLSAVTFGIYGLVWTHKLCNRIGRELNRRELGLQNFSASDFWIWAVLGSVIGGFVASILAAIAGAVAAAAGMDIAAISGIELILSCASMVGPMVFLHKLCEAVNLMNKDYNLKG